MLKKKVTQCAGHVSATYTCVHNNRRIYRCCMVHYKITLSPFPYIQDCMFEGADIIFVVDESGSIGEHNIEQAISLK